MALPVACCTLEISGAEQKRLVAMFKALGNPVRLEIVKFLVTHPGCITGDIVDYLPIAQATVSQHLKVLKDSGLISGIISVGRCPAVWRGDFMQLERNHTWTTRNFLMPILKSIKGLLMTSP